MNKWTSKKRVLSQILWETDFETLMWEADQNMFSEAAPVLGKAEQEEGEGEV